MLWIATLLAVGGFACLGIVMQRHAADLLGHDATARQQWLARLAGIALLAAALQVCVAALGLSLGIAAWFGVMTPAALGVGLAFTALAAKAARPPGRVAAVIALSLACTLLLPAPVLAHRSFLVPSSTILSGPGQWLTVDAARGNDLFYFNHNAMPVDGLVITAPDGRIVEPAKLERFRYRAVFDVQITEPGTWRAAVVDDGLRASWQENGQPRRWTGARDAFPAAVPSAAEKLAVAEVQSRVEVFVSAGKPSPVTPVGRGLEIAYQPHPNDLVAGEPAVLRVLADGKPAAGLEVTIAPGGGRYRDATGSRTLKTDGDGRVTVVWPEAGLYWVHAALRGPAQAPATRRTVSYAATLEVMPR